MRNNSIDIEELKRIQLNILLAVHDYCINNNINYSLSSGTLLGAVRHKGFIPWDDDIDICLLRSEYKKLETVFPQILEGKYMFHTLDRDESWKRPWGKICDKRTELEEGTSCNQRGEGIGIDVFPMDDVPDDSYLFNKWNKRRRLYVLLWSIKPITWSRNRSFINNLITIIIRFFLFPISLRRLAKVIDSYIQKTNEKGYSRVYESCDSLKAINNQSKDDFDDYIDMTFEGHLFKVIKGYDDYLRNIYGNYMVLPPENKRVSTHNFTAWWK